MVPRKKVIGLVKLQVQASPANPAPPINPTLSQHGVNTMEFYKAYNIQTESVHGSIVPTKTTVYGDYSFDFVLKTSSAPEVIHKAAGIQKDSGTPNTVKVTSLTWGQVAKIAEEKMKDLNANDTETAKKVIAGTARSMGAAVD